MPKTGSRLFFIFSSLLIEIQQHFLGMLLAVYFHMNERRSRLNLRHSIFSLFLSTFFSLQAQASANLCSGHLVTTIATSTASPRLVEIHKTPSKALLDPVADRARELMLYDDFKVLADLSVRDLSDSQKLAIYTKAKTISDEKKRVGFLIESLYENKDELLPTNMPEVKPAWTIDNSQHRSTFEHIERMWNLLVRKTPEKTTSSLIPLPHPILIPGARFQEGYYWDSMFAFPALLKTGREKLVRGQIENFLFLLKNYGLIPNGTRDYYLSRSQPPLISEMVRIYVDYKMKNGGLDPAASSWVTNEAYPLIKKDYETFWMNENTRFRKETGLNHFFDSQNTPRPERHSSDKESEIAKTYRDVRAEAESGKDFTAAFDGEATQYESVMLNSLLFQVETNLSWMAKLAGKETDSHAFEAAAQRRKVSIDKYLWDSKTQTYRDYNFRTKQFSNVITADIFIPLYVGLANPKQASGVRNQLAVLEKKGGLMSSAENSGKQWDAPYGWAPHHFFAISGLKKYGFAPDSIRLAEKWVSTVDNIFNETGKTIEKIDAVQGGVPSESGDKYPTQDGFLWTNGVYVWAITDILNIKPLAK